MSHGQYWSLCVSDYVKTSVTALSQERDFQLRMHQKLVVGWGPTVYNHTVLHRPPGWILGTPGTWNG